MVKKRVIRVPRVEIQLVHLNALAMTVTLEMAKRVLVRNNVANRRFLFFHLTNNAKRTVHLIFQVILVCDVRITWLRIFRIDAYDYPSYQLRGFS